MVKNTNDITTANIDAWNEAGPIHKRINHEKELEAFSNPEHSCLDAIEIGHLKTLDVNGKEIAQVCCNNGRELISVKRMGAKRCVGFDGAEEFILQARELAKAANTDVEFICTDIYNLDKGFEANFDIVTITIGVLAWMPDINTFINIVSGLLKPDGALFIYEQHPILDMIKPGTAKDGIEWELSYFNKQPYVETDGLDYFEGEKYEAKPVTSFTHTMSNIITACLDAGMRLEHFEELPGHISNTWWNVENSQVGLPMSFTLITRKA